MQPDLASARIKEALKRLMRRRGLTYQDLGQHLGVSLATVKRVMTSEELTLSRLLQICDWLQIGLAELEAAAKEDDDEAQFTEEQELFLAAEPHYLTYLSHLYDGYTPVRIAEKYAIDKASTEHYLRKLEQLGLVRVTGKGRAVPAHRSQPRWISRGELARAHYVRLMGNFGEFFVHRVQARFAAAPTNDSTLPIYSTLNCQPMSRATYDVLQTALAAATHKASIESEMEIKIHGEEALGRAAVMVCYTWLPPGATVDELEHVFGPVLDVGRK